MPFTFTRLRITDLVVVESRRFADDRGHFFETYKTSEFAANDLPTSFAQGNQSRSLPGVVRGLHFQRHPHAQGKYVSVVEGAVWDVAVDIRVGSPTYGQWDAVELRAGDGRALWIPVGFAHGFCVLGDCDAVLSYQCTAEFEAASDGGIRWDDPTIGVAWPLTRNPILSAKDESLPLLADSDHGFVF